jgi:ABC-type transport system involved in multi-copper enzyme maturation permease subunit
MASTSEPSQKHLLTANAEPASGALWSLLGRILYPKWLLGPILDKELRVSARRKRNYAVRLAYVAMLAIVIGLVWYEEIGSRDYSSYNPRSGHSYYGPDTYLSYMMSQVGATLVKTVVWFQFLMAQLFAAIALSTAISEETNRRTLGVLLSTPVTALQVVMGKLSSKMLQILMLLAISLPILAVVRVFGGIPWDYVVAGLCLTFCCSLFAAALSLLCSIHTRHAYWAIFATLILLLAAYGLSILVGVFFARNGVSESTLDFVFGHFHPFFPLVTMTQALNNPYRTGRLGAFAWQSCCLISLAMTAGLVLLSVARVRKVSLRQAEGGTGKVPRKAPLKTARPYAGVHHWPTTAPIRRVSGAPMIWKETRRGLLRGHARWIVPACILGLLVLSYLLLGRQITDDMDIQTGYIVVLLILACLLTLVLSPTSVTSEREARSLPVLLMTNLSDFAIVLGKTLGVARRVWPIWMLPIIHVALMLALFSEPSRTRTAYIHPILALHILMICAYTLAFLCAMGMLIGTLVKNSTTAVILTLVAALVIWLGIPLAADAVNVGGNATSGLLSWTNPFYQASIVTEGAARSYSFHQTVDGNQYWSEEEDELRYDFVQNMDAGGATIFVAFTAACFFGASALMLCLASMALRRRNE